MSLKYAVEIFYSEEDEGYIAIAPELPGCSAFGETEEEALKEIKTAVALWLETAKKEKRDIPAPQGRPVLTGFSADIRESFTV
jgi:predicted RNase H-like HicB family nuclease